MDFSVSHAQPWNIMDHEWRDWWRNSQFHCSLYKINKYRNKRLLNTRVYCNYMYSHTGTQRKTLNRVSTVCQEQEKKIAKREGQQGKRQQMNIKLPCWGIYLRLLLGWRRSCCTAASAAAMAAPASSRWVWVTLVLLWLRDGPWERRCPSEEDLELPGLLWDFSMVGTCMSTRKMKKYNSCIY